MQLTSMCAPALTARARAPLLELTEPGGGRAGAVSDGAHAAATAKKMSSVKPHLFGLSFVTVFGAHLSNVGRPLLPVGSLSVAPAARSLALAAVAAAAAAAVATAPAASEPGKALKCHERV